MSSTNDRSRILVCGGGHQGLAMSAHLAANGNAVNLWNRTPSNISRIMKTRKIKYSGVMDGEAALNCVSSNIEEVIADTILVTTPSTAHKDIAEMLAPYVHSDMVIVLNPGRTFGVIEFSETLKRLGVREMPHIAETQTIIYTCRRSGEDSVHLYSLKNDVALASKGSNEKIMEAIPSCIQAHFSAKDTIGITSFGNVGMVLHCAPVLFNAARIDGEEPLFKFYSSITPTIATFIESIDRERISVAKAFSIDVESTANWMRRMYGVSGNTLYETLRDNAVYSDIDAPASLRCRYLDEDVSNGLVPIWYLAHEVGLSTPYIEATISMASLLMNKDYRNEGRTYSVDLLSSYF